MEDGNLNDLWKRNLGKLVKCRSFREVYDNSHIDEPIKLFMARDMNGLLGRFFVVAERRGAEEFIIGDGYPSIVTGSDGALELSLYSIFPISPDRILILVDNGAIEAPQGVIQINKELLKRPVLLSDGKSIRYPVRKMYEQDVKFINAIVYNAASEIVSIKRIEGTSFDEYPSIFQQWRH